MQRFFRKTVLAAGVFLAAQSAFADDLVTILDLAMRNDPALRQAQAQLRSGQQQLTLARSSLLPQANASVSEQRQSTGPAGDISYTSLDASSRRYSLGINQSLLNMPNWYSYQ